MNTENLRAEIEKTGFVLEYHVSRALQAHGWNVISNKYYVDDLQETVREIDIVAYKTLMINHIRLYTTIILSCKKSESDAWVLLSKKRDPDDPNMDWYPVHVWSNDKVMSYQVSGGEWRRGYSNMQDWRGCEELATPAKRHIFAFQEMNLESGKPNNDRNIFTFVTALMKAQAYELTSLPQRRHDPVIYQFNLLSVLDTELCRLDCAGETITPREIESDIYVANYIIHKRQTSARIHFVTWKSFERIVSLYDKLHEANLEFFKDHYQAFYKNVETDGNRLNVLLTDFQQRVRYPIRQAVRSSGVDVKPDDIFLSWSTKLKVLFVYVPISEELVAIEGYAKPIY